MHRKIMPYRHGFLSSSNIFFLGFSLVILLFIANIAIAQSTSHNGGQWLGVGGKMLISGNGHFSNKWIAAHRYGHGNGKYWKNDEPTSNPATGKQIPARHTQDEVDKDVWKLKGHIKVLGPGFLGIFMRSKGAYAVLKRSTIDSVFRTHDLGRDQWVTSSDGKGRWQLAGVVNVDPTNSNATGGWVPAGEPTSVDVWVYNPLSHWGVWGKGYGAPKDVEFEVWFFPRRGGKVIEVFKYCRGKKIDITTGDKPCRREPFVYKPKVDIGAPTNREGAGSR